MAVGVTAAEKPHEHDNNQQGNGEQDQHQGEQGGHNVQESACGGGLAIGGKFFCEDRDKGGGEGAFAEQLTEHIGDSEGVGEGILHPVQAEPGVNEDVTKEAGNATAKDDQAQDAAGV